MLKRIRSIWRAAFSPAAEEVGAPALLLRWLALNAFSLGGLLLLSICGVFEQLDELQLSVLGGHPFYLSAEDAQASLLSPGATWALCAALSLYLGGVLLLQPRLSRRNHLCLLAAAAAGLPGLMCVLWHGVLYVAPLLVCILLLWLAVVPLVFIRRLFR